LIKPLAWITGANGLIGNYIIQIAPRFAPRWCMRALTRGQFDLLDFETVNANSRKTSRDWLSIAPRFQPSPKRKKIPRSRGA